MSLRGLQPLCVCPPPDLMRGATQVTSKAAQAQKGLLLAGVVTGKVAALHTVCLVSHLSGTRCLCPEPAHRIWSVLP